MRELTYLVAVSLDGRIAAPDGDFSAFPMAGDHIDALIHDWTDTLPAMALGALDLTADRSRFDTVVMGWDTYAAGFPSGVRDPYPHLDQVVATRRHRDEAVPDGIRLVDDPVAEVRRLKQLDGSGIWLCGGGELATALSGDIDRLVLKVNPVLLGDGRPVFGGAYHPRTFTLVHSASYDSGVVINQYRRAD